MNSLKEVWQGLQAQDQQEKVAAPSGAPDLSGVDPGLLKQAEDYDTIGRILAHQVFDDLVKEAAPVGHGPGFKHSDNTWCEDDCGGHAQQQGEEKVAGAEAVLARMANDPAYAAQLIAKHAGRLQSR